MEACRNARRVDAIDWTAWEAVDQATLLFVVRDDRILLIRKKRGLGAGKINGPGGRLEAGETAREAAVREVVEEICVEPTGIDHAGELHFQFTDGYSIHVQVYRADGYRGEPRETDEAVPLWFDLGAVPYDEMWEDDRLWLPEMLAGTWFSGRFVFEDDRMLDHELTRSEARPTRAEFRRRKEK